MENYCRLYPNRLRLFFFWMVMRGYVSQETADTFLLDEEMIRAIEATVGSVTSR
ncbi:p031 [Rhizobium phage 16-3]|uniref:p031 n=1 Tax=Rhizobium phage 16-3 TaxID=10704 RepID=UPI00017BA5C3|nr:p031 [Rhizobium phage 16-3]ABF71283.1 p031 [Rhizobium phage 16-3]